MSAGLFAALGQEHRGSYVSEVLAALYLALPFLELLELACDFLLRCPKFTFFFPSNFYCVQIHAT